MRVLGWVLAGALAVTASIGVQAGSLGPGWYPSPTVGTVTGVEHPAPRANGTADRFRRVGARIVFPAGGPAVRGQGSPLTGSGAPAAAPSIIPSPIGAGRLGVGVTHSQRGLPFE